MKPKTILLLAICCLMCTAGTFTCKGSTDDSHPRTAHAAPALR